MSYSITSTNKTTIKSSKIKATKITMAKNHPQKNLLSIEIKYYPWTKVSEIRTKLASINGVPPKNIRLFFKNEELMNNLTMIMVSHSKSILKFFMKYFLIKKIIPLKFMAHFPVLHLLKQL